MKAKKGLALVIANADYLQQRWKRYAESVRISKF